MSDHQTSAAPELAATVIAFAERSRAWPERLLEHEAWAWDDYEGPRFAHLHTVMTLRALAARIRIQRANKGPLQSLVHHALGDAQTAFRTLEALVAPLSAEELDRVPATGEQTVREVLAHVHKAEVYFALTIGNALTSDGGRDASDEEIFQWADAALAIIKHGSAREAWNAYATEHAQMVDRFSVLTDIQAERLSAMWESQPYPILWRLYRIGAHIREHTIQVEKSLARLGLTAQEGDLHARQVYAALGEVEAALIGAGHVGREACLQTAKELGVRYESLLAAWNDIERFVAAVESDDVEAARELVALRPALARTRISDTETARLYALYRGRRKMVHMLRDAPFRLSPQESACFGDADRLLELLKWYPELLNQHARDGFTLLHLASYFRQPAAVALLLEKGADPNAVSTNAQQLTAIHSAVAGRDLECVSLLLAAGADPTLRQEGGFTPLMAALKNGDEEIVELLRNAGADA